MGGGGGGSLESTNAISPTEASADLSGALGQSQTGGVWGIPNLQAISQGTGNPAGIPEATYTPGAGVQTGIPQGGFAGPGIASYFAGAGTAPGGNLSYDPGQHDTWLGSVDAGTQEGVTQFQQQAAEQAAAANEAVDLTGGAGTLETLGGGEIAYDNAFEQPLAEQIAANIEAGGLNENGDPFVSAGPNVLSAADEGLFGYGGDYNQEFGENYDANAAHAGLTGSDDDGWNTWDPNAPIGQTTGTPLYDQGYVGLGVDPLADAVGGAINNSTIGMIGSAITGNSLMADVDSLLPPSESFSNSGSDDNNSPASNPNQDGDPTNDTGNAGWGFTSIADMFDGGGPGTSGDSFTGGVHGGSTSGSSGSSTGGTSSGGYGCYVATALNEADLWSEMKKMKLLAWCMKAKPEGKLDTTLWRNGYCVFGKEIVAPRVSNPVIQWLSDGFYNSTVKKQTTFKALLGKTFFYLPSYAIGLWKMARGTLVEIDRT